jgi:hypothetical protein
MRVRVVGGVLAVLAGVLLKLGGLVRVFPYLETKAHDHFKELTTTPNSFQFLVETKKNYLSSLNFGK